METIDSRKRAVYWIHTFVYFLITFCFGYLPFHALTPFGMTIVGIFIGLLYGWTFIGFVWRQVCIYVIFPKARLPKCLYYAS